LVVAVVVEVILTQQQVELQIQLVVVELAVDKPQELQAQETLVVAVVELVQVDQEELVVQVDQDFLQ
jgi:hypothetical protein